MTRRPSTPGAIAIETPREHVQQITICRPQARNALTAEAVVEIGATLSDAETDPDVPRVEIDSAGPGDLVALTGLETINIGDTLSDVENPVALPRIKVDEPTIAIVLSVSNSPMSGLKSRGTSSAWESS